MKNNPNDSTYNVLDYGVEKQISNNNLSSFRLFVYQENKKSFKEVLNVS